jgi:ubiquinone/menaquinone biosynthesis C-methylase UbiE
MSSHRLIAASGYTNVDMTGDTMKYARRLDRMRTSAFWRAIKDRTFELLLPPPGAHLLDVGCGTGDDVRALSLRVGPAGRVMGVDKSKEMIAEARRRAYDLAQLVEFKECDARELPFAVASFNGCRAERVLQHMRDPDRALSEMIRVIEPTGHVVTVEPDYGTLSITGAEMDITRTILRVRNEHFQSARIGAQLPLLMKRLGLRDIKVQVAPLTSTGIGPEERAQLQKYVLAATSAGSISVSQGEEWLSALEYASNAGRYRHSVKIFIVSGEKP